MGDNNQKLRAMLRDNDVEWLLPPGTVAYTAHYHAITRGLHEMGVTPGERNFLITVLDHLFDVAERKIPSMIKIAQEMCLHSVSGALRYVHSLDGRLLRVLNKGEKGRALRIDLAPLFFAIKRKLGLVDEQPVEHLDAISATLSDFAAEIKKPIYRVSNYRKRLETAANIAQWSEYRLQQELRDTILAAKQDKTIKQPVGWVVRAVERKAGIVMPEKKAKKQAPEQNISYFKRDEIGGASATEMMEQAFWQQGQRALSEEQYEQQAERAQPEEAHSAGTQDTAPDESDNSSGPSALPANPSADTPGDDAGPGDDLEQRGDGGGVLGGMGEETIPDDAPACLREAFRQYRERGAWPFVRIETLERVLFIAPTPDSWFNFAEQGSAAEHKAAERALRERLERLKPLPPLAAAGGD